MADLVNISLDVHLNRPSKEKVQGIVNDIQKDLKPLYLKLKIDDSTAKNIEEIGKKLEGFTNVGKTANINSIGKQITGLTDRTKEWASVTSSAFGEHSGKLGKLAHGFSVVHSQVSKFNDEGKETQRIFKLLDAQQQNMRTVKMFADGTTTHQDTEYIAKAVKDNEKIVALKNQVNERMQNMLTLQHLNSAEAVKYHDALKNASYERVKEIDQSLKNEQRMSEVRRNASRHVDNLYRTRRITNEEAVKYRNQLEKANSIAEITNIKNSTQLKVQ